MATITLECDYCGDEFEAKRRTARFCKPSHGAAYRRVAAEGSDSQPDRVDDAVDEVELDPSAGPVHAATFRELQRTMLLGTVHGATALAIAKDVDDAEGASSRAVAARELRLTMQLARQVGNPFSPAGAVGDAEDDDDSPSTGAAAVPNLADMRARAEARKQRAGG